MPRLPVVLLLGVAAAVALPQAQQQPQFRSGTHTVSVYATVADATGRLVPNLSKDDFEIYDNGKRQDLTIFQNAVQPITIVIMLDRSGSVERNFSLVRDAASQFVSTLLPDDRARLGSFSNRVEIDPVEFTSSKDELFRILHENLQDAGPTPLWNATAAAMTALAHEPGRRVVLLFTDGKDSPGRAEMATSFDTVRDRSQAEEVMIYAIGLADRCGAGAPAPDAGGLFFQRGGGPGGTGGTGRSGPRPGMPGRGGRIVPGRPGGLGPGRPPGLGGGRIGGVGGGSGPRIPGPPMPMPPGPGVEDRLRGRVPNRDIAACASTEPDPHLRELADEGGGGYFELHGTDNLATTFSRVAEELHQQYLLAFTASALDGRTHKIEVRMREPGLTARGRKSYLAAADR